MKHPSYPLRTEQSQAVAALLKMGASSQSLARVKLDFDERRDIISPKWREEYAEKMEQWKGHDLSECIIFPPDTPDYSTRIV